MKVMTDIGREQPIARGFVQAAFINVKTGERIPIFERRNILTYTAADTMARILAGETAYAPGYMGFIYGAGAAPAIIDPPTSRVHDWASVGEELADPAIVGNVNIVALATPPSISVDGDATLYAGNSTTFTAHSTSGSDGTYGFPVVGGTYAPELADGSYFYHALLLTKIESGSTTTYWPFARVTLKTGTYQQKPAGFELALFWQVSFF